MRLKPLLQCFAFILIFSAPVLLAQQTGSISGKVTASDGTALPGVTVEARSTVLPQPRVTTTSETGEFRFPVLPPGNYTVEFSLSGMQTVTRNAKVLLGQYTMVNGTLGVQQVAETITVTAEASLVDARSTEIASALSSEVIQELPVGQEYRDLVKLLPSVTYTEDTVRGPSAGGSGQDNVYHFDGVNVTLPLFGTLSAEPSSYDIGQISVVKGGAKAVDFNRAAGFTIDSVSKSGTSEFAGEVSYQIQTDSMRADDVTPGVTTGARDASWATLSLGGPILRDRLFFYGSYYRPEVERDNRSNLYGEVPDLKSTRDELFGKLTFTPTSAILLHGSYRDSEKEERGFGVTSSTTAGTLSVGNDSTLEIGILEGSWVVNPRSFATFKFTDFANPTLGRPDILLDVRPSLAPGTRLDVNNLETMGRLAVPNPITGNASFNQFIAPIIEKYGFVQDGVRRGGGLVGADFFINDQDFFRQSWQVGYDYTLGSRITHDLHAGFQWSLEEEDLTRTYNGWGQITVTGGRTNCPAACGPNSGQPIFYTARFIRGVLPDVPVKTIHSEFESQNLELNDTIGWNNWTFNVGILASNDTLFGQGLREDPSTVSGFVVSPGTMYEMYKIDFEDQIQPRLGATWAYNGRDTLYASYGRFHPAASSLPRAAAWDRNTTGLFVDAFFDANGNLIGSAPVGSSSGKFFQDDLKPRVTDEYLLGTARQISNRWTGRLYTRYRRSYHFWEDTNNDARVLWAPEGYPKELYIPDLAAFRAQLGGSSYVIAELDNAFTKYYEASLESEWRGNKAFFRGSYTWSHYYGTFDQDNTAGGDDDDINTFIGSSNLADGPGRQLWDFKYGDLHGDRRHLLKLIGYCSLPWRATAGAFGVYQSGQPWEAENYEIYKNLPGFGTSTSDLIRYGEPAGSRRTEDHYQIDLNYTQNFPIAGYNLQLDVDLFNVTDNQTGYDPRPSIHRALFGVPYKYYDPRRFQVALRFQF